MEKKEFLKVWETNHYPLYASIYHFVGNPHEAEDILHDLAVAAICQWDGIRDKEAWLYGVALKMCRRHIAKRKRETPVEDVGIYLPDALEEAHLEKMIIIDYMRTLPCKTRHQVLLNLVYRYSAREIASVYGEKQATVSKRITRVINKMARIVSDSGE